MNAKEVKF